MVQCNCNVHDSKMIRKDCAYLHFHEHVGLHESWRGHEEGGVGDAPGGGDDLPATAVDRLVGNIQYSINLARAAPLRASGISQSQVSRTMYWRATAQGTK